MHRRILTIAAAVSGSLLFFPHSELRAQQTDQQLLQRISDLERQVGELKTILTSRAPAAEPVGVAAAVPAVTAPPAAVTATVPAQEHDMAAMLGVGDSQGPAIRFHGFFDVNLDAGSAANSLVYPLGRPAHTSFRLGELNLLMTSRLSDTVSFLGETVFSSDSTNETGVDIERAQLTYKPNDYFQISAGRFHQAIGYYSTAHHHGVWFSTATGRPFMYFFEDSGGILPIHGIGVSAQGLVKGTGRLNLHWIAELSNGRASPGQTPASAPAQNFASDRNHKAFNFAAYVRPDQLQGLQIGSSFYKDHMRSAGPDIDQDIESFHAVFINSRWEFLNEFVAERNRTEGSGHTSVTPMAYSQLSRKVGAFRPYVRYQYVNVPSADPLNSSVGRFNGPSVGLRFDAMSYAALKLQYNRLYTRSAPVRNGVNGQLAFTF